MKGDLHLAGACRTHCHAGSAHDTARGPRAVLGRGGVPRYPSVFIGRNLDRGMLLAGLRSWIALPARSE